MTENAKPAELGLATIVKFVGQLTDPAVQFDLLGGVHDALRGRRREPMPSAWPATYAKLIESPAATVRSESHALALIFGDPQALESLKRTAADGAIDVTKRRESLDVLVEAHAANLAPLLQKLLDTPELRGASASRVGRLRRRTDTGS